MSNKPTHYLQDYSDFLGNILDNIVLGAVIILYRTKDVFLKSTVRLQSKQMDLTHMTIETVVHLSLQRFLAVCFLTSITELSEQILN